MKEMWFYFQYDAKTRTAEYCHFAHYYEAPFHKPAGPEVLCNGFTDHKEHPVNEVMPKKNHITIEKTIPLKNVKYEGFPDKLDCSRDFMEPLRVDGTAIKAAVHGKPDELNPEHEFDWHSGSLYRQKSD